jgi:hypothetical protein
MHKEILTKEQIQSLSLVQEFSESFYLVGGTAIALHLGHRQSVDFDLFTADDIVIEKIRRKILKHGKIERVYEKSETEYTISVNNVKFTFLTYPYPVEASFAFEKIKLPDLITLSAMKAYALGRRTKWKDYVDLYFVVKDHYSIAEISKKAKELFAGEFNEKIFREALGYFKDINYEEKVIFMPGFEADEETIKKALTEFSVN